MLKISQVGSDPSPVVLRLEGRLAGLWVEELANICNTALGLGKPVCLDMAEVSFVDRPGLALLLKLRARNIALEGCSPFVDEQLKAGSPLA